MRLFLFYIAMFWICFFAQGQSKKFTRISNEQGLANSHVTCLLQDNTGFLWIGTKDGLCRYDGYQIEVFQHAPGDTTTLGGNYIRTLFQDSSGLLWVGTTEGLSIFDPVKTVAKKFNGPANLLKINITSIFEDSKGYFWISTDGDGLYKIDMSNGVSTRYTHNPEKPETIAKNGTMSVTEAYGSIWVGTWGGGISRYDPINNVFRHYAVTEATTCTHITKLVFDQNHLFATTFHKGVMVYDTIKDDFVKLYSSNLDLDDAVYDIRFSKDNKLWIASLNGLVIMDMASGQATRYKYSFFDKTTISTNMLSSLIRDHAGNMWIGSFGAGLNFHDHYQKPFISKNLIQGPFLPNDNQARTIFLSSENQIWIGSTNGIKVWDQELNPIAKPELSIINDLSINTIQQGNDPLIYIGTSNRGLYIYDENNKRLTHKRHVSTDTNSLSNNNIHTILPSHDRSVWVGTNDGLNHYNPTNETFRRIRIKGIPGSTMLAENQIMCLLETKNGELWIGSKQGLRVINPSTYEIERNFARGEEKDSGLTSNHIISLLEDQHGNIWIGTVNGLNKYNRETGLTTHYSGKNTFLNSYIAAIQQDANNHLWISTHRGITHYDPLNKIFHNYTKSDGIQGNEFLMGSASKLWDGMLSFGGISGFTLFHPDSITDNPVIPPVLITGFNLFNKPVSIYDLMVRSAKSNQLPTIKISYKQHMFSFDFVGLNYSDPASNQYKYMLKGFNDQWIDAESNRRASYTNIQPGEYIFMVMASNNDDLWNNTPASIRLVITPPWWRTWWFRIPFTLFVFVLIFSGYSYRINFLRRQKEILEQRVGERSRELYQTIVNLEETQKEISIKNNELSRQYQHLEQKNAQLELHRQKFLNLQSLLKEITRKLRNIENGQPISIFVAEVKTLLKRFSGLLKDNNHIGNELAEDMKDMIVSESDHPLRIITGNYHSDREIILIVENQIYLGSEISVSLGEEYRIFEASDAGSALEIAESTLPDVIIFNIAGNGQPAVEFCDALKQNAYTNHIPLLILTTVNDEATKINLFKAGADDIIIHPLEIAYIKTRLKNLIDNRKNLQVNIRREMLLQPQNVNIVSVEEKFLTKVVEIIEKNIDNPDLDVEILVNELAMSRAQLYRKFKAVIGQPANEFIRNFRIKRAAQLLEDGNLNVSEVIHKVGISSRSYFTKAFKETFGVTPSEYSFQKSKSTTDTKGA
jgi:ligand-binding sensor domain-containing protein/AraC-like DNA-binding protein/CheY-like chemotaxis protein